MCVCVWFPITAIAHSRCAWVSGARGQAGRWRRARRARSSPSSFQSDGEDHDCGLHLPACLFPSARAGLRMWTVKSAGLVQGREEVSVWCCWAGLG